MKTEIWNDHLIRFVKIDGEWWGVANDICSALGIKNARYSLRTLKGVVKYDTLTDGGSQKVNIIDEKNIYRLVFKSRKKEAIEFQDWIFDVIKELRKSSGLQGYEVFNMLEKNHHKKQMRILVRGLGNPTREDFVKANTLANQIVSEEFGYSKVLRKRDMTKEMLLRREMVIEEVVRLMILKDERKLEISVLDLFYGRYN